MQYLLITNDVHTNEGALTSQGTKRRILVVDDEPDITLTLQAGLEDGGFDVDAFTDPELVLSSFKPGLYDLVLIDITMPKMDGFALYERLKTIDPGVKICFLTASEMYHEEIREEKYSSLDNELFIQKPISTDDLIKKINNKINLKLMTQAAIEESMAASPGSSGMLLYFLQREGDLSRTSILYY